MQSLSAQIPEVRLAQDVYTDLNGLSQLRLQAQSDPDAGLKAVARQFEALFMQMVLKSMREASFGDPFFDNSQSELYQDMFDKQLTLNMSGGKGIGLAEMLTRQLRSRFGDQLQAPENPFSALGQSPQAVSRPDSVPRPEPRRLSPLVERAAALKAAASAAGDEPAVFDSPRDFIRHMRPLAEEAARELGVEPGVLLAQAALETGWGRHISRRADGRSSHNLFNIKAGGDWDGARVSIGTLEYRDGLARRERAAFRAYDSYAESFHDYVDFLRSRPRYRAALEQAGDAEGYVRELHGAGYATDPAYADKILDILQRPMLQAALHEGGVHAG